MVTVQKERGFKGVQDIKNTGIPANPHAGMAAWGRPLQDQYRSSEVRMSAHIQAKSKKINDALFPAP
jgi:hypothetical protein